MTGGRDSHVAMLLRMTRVVFTQWDNSIKDDMDLVISNEHSLTVISNERSEEKSD